MGYFPMCISLDNAHIILAGEGTAAMEKLKVLLPFGAEIHIFSRYGFAALENHPQIQVLRKDLTENDLKPRPAFVVVADVSPAEKERISGLCHEKNIPVNVVDVPKLCSFYFPALIQKGDLTISVSTGGKSPGAASYLRRQLEARIPDQSDVILDWLSEVRKELPREISPDIRRRILKQAVELAFQQNRPLTEVELQQLLSEILKLPDELPRKDGPGGESGK